MKKKLLGALACLVAGLSLASCTPKDYSHIIVFWHTMGDSLQAVLNPAIEAFEEKYKDEGWKVESTQIGSYNDVRNQTISYIAAGNNPSLVYCYPDHIATYNKSSQVVDLNDYINDSEVGFSKEELDDFIEGYYNEGSAFGDGAMYSLPFSKSTEVLYYNKTVFEEEDLEVPTTWEEMEEVCRVLKLRYPDSTPLGIDSESNWFITTAMQKGAGYTSATGEHYIFDNADNRASVEMLKDWYSKGYVTTQTIYGTYTSGLFTSTQAKRSFMSIGSTGGAAHQIPANRYFEVGMAPIPTFDGKDLKVISQGPSLCMLKQDDNEDKMKMTWIFMKEYLLNTEFQAEFSMASGYNPVLKSTYNNPVYASWLSKADGYEQAAALAASTSRTFSDNFFVSDAFLGSSGARDEVGNLVVNYLQGFNNYKTLDEAFATALKNCKKGS